MLNHNVINNLNFEGPKVRQLQNFGTYTVTRFRNFSSTHIMHIKKKKTVNEPNPPAGAVW